MLEALRNATGTWIAKIFIALLVMSFAVWGVADIFGGYGAQTLAKVGETEIGTEQYRRALQNEMRRLGRESGRNLTIEEARNAGIDRQVLGSMLNDAALQSHGGELKLNISEQWIADGIINEPAFRGPSGSFDRFTFEQLLANNGLTEQAYVAQMRSNSIRQQLAGTLTEPVSLPRTMIEALNIYQNEKRTLDYITVSEAKIEPIPQATDDQLRKHFEANARAYVAPEYRRIGLLVLDPKVMAETITVSDDSLREYFESAKESYFEPERRHIQQISFPTKEEADAARKKLDEGMDFMALATERGLSEQDVDLGTVTKSDMIDSKIADAAFALEKDVVSAPVAGTLTTAILRVIEIQPESQKTFEEVKPEIRQRLAQEQAANDILDIHDRIEDERAGGASLKEVAKTIDANYTEIPAIDRTGRALDGEPVKNLPDGPAIIRTTFESDVGVENDPIETEDQGFIWVDVAELIPERQKPYEEVREQVVSDWKHQEVRQKLAKFGGELVQRLRDGETMQKLAGELQVEAKQSQPITRVRPSSEIPQAAVAQAFVLKQGQAGSAPSADDKSRIIFQVAKVEAPPPLTAQQSKQLEQTVAGLVRDDYFSQYLDGLRNTFGVTINEAAVNQVTGRER